MEEKTNFTNQLVFLMDENINSVQIGVYSVAAVGLAVALRTVRPFSRFSRPSDIPNRFIRSKMKLNGTVERIEPNGALLMVQHKPLFRILRTKVDSLPVKISGVTVNGHGISWLQSVVAGNEVSFVPVLKEKDWVQCEVTMQQTTHDKKIQTLNVGPSLVEIGFGQVSSVGKPLSNDPLYMLYYRQLQVAESNTYRKRLGKWYYVKSTQEFSKKLLNLLVSLIKSRAKLPAKTKPALSNVAST